MKMFQLIGVVGLISALYCGCCCPEEHRAGRTGMDQDRVNRAIVENYYDRLIAQAIVSQHTLYPYHFVDNSGNLSALGHGDLSILIAHLQEHPGPVSVQQGSADRSLYQARRQTVRDRLAEAGLSPDAAVLTDRLPGGDGMPSTAVLEIMDQSRETPAPVELPSGVLLQY